MAWPTGTMLMISVQVVALAVLAYRFQQWGVFDASKYVPKQLHHLLQRPACGHLQSVDFDLVSHRVVLPDGVAAAAVQVRKGKIAAVVPLTPPPGTTLLDHAKEVLHNQTSLLDFSRNVIAPGIVDVHVHMDEPGRTHWEGMETATKAAAAGGITTIVDMPLNNDPSTTTAALVHTKIAAAKGKLMVDVGFWGGLVPDNSHNSAELRAMLDAGVLGFKTFLAPSGIDDFPNASRADLEASLPVFKTAGVPHLLHCELVAPLPPPEGDPTHHATWLAQRPRSFEEAAVNMVLDVLRKDSFPAQPGFKYHVVHLSDADLLPTLKAAKQEGLPLSVETCPHYLNFASEEVGVGDTRFKCAPPLREGENRGRIWDGLKEGIIDSIASDHSPAPPEMRKLDTGNFLEAWGGIAGLQYTLPAVFNGLEEHEVPLHRMSTWLSAAPARLAGLSARKGGIAAGLDADLMVFDPEALADTSPEGLYHRHKQSPYAGREMKGRVRATFVRGQLVFADWKGMAPVPCGQTLLRGSL